MIYSEREALDRLGIDSFSRMTEDRIPAFARMLPEMDSALALNALNQFPQYTRLAGGIVDCYMGAVRNALESNSETTRSAARTIQTAAEALSKQLENENLSWIVRSDINDKLIELSRMQVDLDKNNKSFLLKAASVVGGVITALGGAALIYFGGRGRRR